MSEMNATEKPLSASNVELLINEVQQAIAPLQDRLRELWRLKCTIESQEFIQAHRLALSDIEMSEGDDKPWFGHIDKFVAWLRSNRPNAKWMEWNGVIYGFACTHPSCYCATPGRITDLL